MDAICECLKEVQVAFFGGYVAPPVAVVVSVYGSISVKGEFNHVEIYGRRMCYDFQAAGRGVCSNRATGKKGSSLYSCKVFNFGLLLCAVCPEMAAIGKPGPNDASVGPLH